ncbi:hypothetical protein G6011_07076 [Alternaria panax]|uniref:Feruloyl esterase C n=1 Tax=Alternaria panax TaxID=48097 RepID=A0AAD4I1P1_9PLEO|nr:hypothetical protein G6011_07076 [Alternaria panax]
MPLYPEPEVRSKGGEKFRMENDRFEQSVYIQAKPRDDSADCRTLGGNAPYYGLAALANETAIFIAPDGINKGRGNQNGKDITFLDTIRKQVEDDLCVDETQRFSLGFSYGVAMSFSLACSRAKENRAIAVLSDASQLDANVMARLSDANGKKRRGRPPGSRNSGAVAKSKAKLGPKSAAAKKGRPKKKAAQEEVADELSIVDAAPTQTSKPRKRKSDEIAEADDESRERYTQLEARTKRIPQEQMDSWPQLPPQVLEQITTVIRNAKKDIAETQRDERRIMAAHNTLNPLVRKLARQLAGSRIPPQAKDIHFNIDKLTERNAQISREVTTARHAKQLLSEQLKIAQHLLNKDEDSLDALKKNVKNWRTEWKHQKKHGRLHPLLQDEGDTTTDRDGPDDIRLKRSEPVALSLLDTPDDDLAPVLGQLRRSLESMQGNHAQIEGLDTAMRDAQAALDDVLFRHAGAAQYAVL